MLHQIIGRNVFCAGDPNGALCGCILLCLLGSVLVHQLVPGRECERDVADRVDSDPPPAAPELRCQPHPLLRDDPVVQERAHVGSLCQ